MNFFSPLETQGQLRGAGENGKTERKVIKNNFKKALIFFLVFFPFLFLFFQY